MEGAVRPSLLEAFNGGVHRLLGSSESTASQHFDLLRMSNFGAGFDHFLPSFEELLSEVSEL